MGNETVYHIDLYRLNDEHEALDIGLDHYFSSGSYCFIEWASKFRNLLPEYYVETIIQIENDRSRQLIISAHGREIKF